MRAWVASMLDAAGSGLQRLADRLDPPDPVDLAHLEETLRRHAQIRGHL